MQSTGLKYQSKFREAEKLCETILGTKMHSMGVMGMKAFFPTDLKTGSVRWYIFRAKDINHPRNVL